MLKSKIYMTIKKILKLILLPPYCWLIKDREWWRKFLSSISPVYASKRLYKRALGKKLNLKNPQTLNEKCMWLKLNTYYNNPLITECCDKYLVRNYVRRVGCEETLNELLGVWDSPDEIDFNKLPNEFVLKCNHGAGYNIVCYDKYTLDIEKTKLQLRKWLKEDYWKLYAETQYKFIDKKIIAESLIKTKSNALPEDYKFFCINGVADCVMICKERATGHPKIYYFDKNFKYYPEYFYLNPTVEEVKLSVNIDFPDNIYRMFEYAEKLSKPFPFVRVDLYNENGKIIFGELTFLSSGGIEHEGYAMMNSAIDITQPILGDI